MTAPSRFAAAARRATILAGIALASVACDGTTTAPADREVLLGGLFSLTGNWSTLGRTGQAALELGVEDVNRYLAQSGAGFHFAAAVEDTKLDPAVALDRAKALQARGARILLGPQSSAEVVPLAAYVGANGMILISPSSTAGSLAVAGDNVFRFTPTDSLEGVAISALMWADGVRTIVPVWRDDEGNAGLERAIRTRFTALGGTVLPGVKYGASVTDFDAVVADVGDQVRQAIADVGAGAVAVYHAAFDEVTALFASASADQALGDTRWYGSDGIANSSALVSDAQAAAFAMRVGLPNPLFGLPDGTRDQWGALADRIGARANVEPDAFALAVYDAVWVLARAHLAAGATLGTDALKQALVAAASTHYGATGWTVLNPAGDRRYGDFDFWAVRDVDGVPQWTRVAYYETPTGRLSRR
jgi:branched-chain amino acid transport system substrate-binding protein